MSNYHDHELLIGSTRDQFTLARDDNDKAMYQVIEDIPPYQPRLRFTQANWSGGHGQRIFANPTMIFEGQSIDITQDGKLFLGPAINEVYENDDSELDTAPLGFFWSETASKWLCWTTGKVYIYGTKWTAATTTLAGVTGMAEFSGFIYAAMGASTKYYYSSDGDTWTQTDLTDGYANNFLIAPNPTGTAENLWKFKTPNELSRTTDGRTVAAGGVQWESPTYVGETSNDITNIFLHANKIYIGKEDGLFWLDSNGGVHPELPGELKVNHSTDNFKYVAQWQTSTYFSLLLSGGELTTADTYRPVYPLVDIDDIGKKGNTVGISSEPEFLYWAVDEGTNTHIYKGREVLTNQGLQWQWCPWVFLSTNTCSTIKVCQHSTTDRRLWFGYGTHTAYVTLSDNPLADSAATYTASGFCRMSYTYGTDPVFDKLWQSAVVEQHRVASGAETAASSGETVQIKYRDDTDTTATSVISAYNTAGVVETNFSSALSNKRIQFEIHLASDTAAATPVVTYFQAKGVEVPTTVRIHEAYYLVGDRRSDRAKTIRTLLRSARTSSSLLKFADLRYGDSTSGTSYVWVVMMPGYPKEVEIRHEKRRQPELAIQVRLQEVSFTVS